MLCFLCCLVVLVADLLGLRLVWFGLVWDGLVGCWFGGWFTFGGFVVLISFVVELGVGLG